MASGAPEFLGGTAEAKPRGKKRAVASKYDVHKVKVWLGDNLDHYYILSRFLVSRSLTITKIPSTKAVKIALELKKHLVDRDKLSVSQMEMEEILFDLMRQRGYGQAYIDCYRTVSAFYQLRQPLVILICGAPCTGKSTIAQQLAARLNMPNVMQTDVICELLRCHPGAPMAPKPPWTRHRQPACGNSNSIRAADEAGDPSSARTTGGTAAGGQGERDHGGAGALGLAPPRPRLPGEDTEAVLGGVGGGGQAPGAAGVWGGGQGDPGGDSGRAEALASVDEEQEEEDWVLSEFRNECRIVRRALEGDFNKALSDGKPLIVEGVHLDPGELLVELQDRGIVLLPLEPQALTPYSSHLSPSPLSPSTLANGSEPVPQTSSAAATHGSSSAPITDTNPNPRYSSYTGGASRGTASLPAAPHPDNSHAALSSPIQHAPPAPFTPGPFGSSGVPPAQRRAPKPLSVLSERQEAAASGPDCGSEAATPTHAKGAGSVHKHVSWGRAEAASAVAAVAAASGQAGGVDRAGRRLGQGEAGRRSRREGGGVLRDGLEEDWGEPKGAMASQQEQQQPPHDRHGSPTPLDVAEFPADQAGCDGDVSRGASVTGFGNHSDGASDVNNYGDNDHTTDDERPLPHTPSGETDRGGDGDISGCGGSSGRPSPALTPQPAPGGARRLPLGAGGSPPMRRAVSQPTFPLGPDGNEDDEEGVEEHDGDEAGVRGSSRDGGADDGAEGEALGPSGVMSRLSHAAGATGLQHGVASGGGDGGGGGGNKPVGRLRSSAVSAGVVGDEDGLQGRGGRASNMHGPAGAGARDAGNSSLPLVAGAGGGGGGGGASFAHISRAQSHYALSAARGARSLASFGRVGSLAGSLATADLQAVKSSLAGILRQGSTAARSSRFATSPAPLRTMDDQGMRAFVQTPGRAFAKDHSLGRTSTPLLAPRWSHAGPLQTTSTPSGGGAAAHEDSGMESPGGPAADVENGSLVQGAGECVAAAAASTLPEASRKGSSGGDDVSVAAEQPRGRGGEAMGRHMADVQRGAVGDGTSIASRGLNPAAAEGLTAPAAPATAAADDERGAALPAPPPPPPCWGPLPPLFVPVVLCMSEEDHALAAEDNLVASSATPGGVGVGPGAGPAEGDGRGGGPSPEEVLRRAQAIQGYLCSFEAQGLPVIHVKYGNFGEALDILHEYILMCIQAAMEQMAGGSDLHPA